MTAVPTGQGPCRASQKQAWPAANMIYSVTSSAVGPGRQVLDRLQSWVEALIATPSSVIGVHWATCCGHAFCNESVVLGAGQEEIVNGSK